MRINLETEKRFKAMMSQLGFKKTSRGFVRPYKDAIQGINVGYATYGQHHVRYYSAICYVMYPLIESVAEEAGFMTYAMGGILGMLCLKIRGWSNGVWQSRTQTNTIYK